MGRAYSIYLGEERCIQAFGGETYGKETTWKTQPGIDGSINIKMDLEEVGWGGGGGGWFVLARDGDGGGGIGKCGKDPSAS